MKKMFCGQIQTILIAYLFCAWLTSCAGASRNIVEAPNYDHLINKSFSYSIFKGRQVYKVIRETEIVEELENRRSDGCILVFGVRKKDDTIAYWRVDSGAGTCKVGKDPLNWNR
jgi:hypothetical protein